ncbi:MAG: efflux RND transporter permease subunit, partial [Pseudomonadota bacterium]
MTQPSIFGRGIGGGRSIELDVSGPELEVILDVALRAFLKVGEVMPRTDGNQVRPRPGLELGAPEIRVFPDRIRLADVGLNARDLGDTVDAFNDGLRIAEITVGGERIDLMLMGPRDDVAATQGIAELPVVTSEGTILPVRALSDVEVVAGPTEIRHAERERTVTLDVRPANAIALEAALEILQTDVIDVLEAEGLPDGVTLNLSGTADKLTQTWDALVLDLLLAIVIVYLVMAVLFESFWYPLIILVAVPVAAAGGVAGLAVLNTYIPQPLDMLTMLGFVILIGIVVNNAILLVDQSLNHVRRDGMAVPDAILEATRNRIRPIFMSTMTSVFGMMPLVLFPGAGSELYRGLGAVVIGGLSLSTIVALVLIPSLLAVFMAIIERGSHRGKQAPAEPSVQPAE